MRLSRAFFSLISAALVSCGAQDAQVGTAVGAEGEANLINAVPLPQNKYTATIVWTYPNYGNGGYLCSGTIVSRNHILTAAHCVAATKSAKRKYDDGTEYDTDLWLPDIAPSISGENARIFISNKRRLPTDVASPLFKSVRVEKVSMGSEWMELSQTEPEFVDFVYSGIADLAVIETQDDLLELFPATKIAQVDVRTVAPQSLMALTGYGCEQSYYDEEDQPVDNWGKTITAEYFYTTSLTVEQAAAAESKWIEDYSYEDALKYNTDMARGYIHTIGEQARQRAVSLCPGDSGSGAYRGVSQQLVVGVNSNSQYGSGKISRTVTNAISRVSTEIEWLSSVLPASSIVR
jgi:hypothetical protein